MNDISFLLKKKYKKNSLKRKQKTSFLNQESEAN
jgi:hypothetical protein